MEQTEPIYFKGFKRLIEDGKGKTPTEIAPGTKVYELVEELAKYLPEKMQKQFLGEKKFSIYKKDRAQK